MFVGSNEYIRALHCRVTHHNLCLVPMLCPLIPPTFPPSTPCPTKPLKQHECHVHTPHGTWWYQRHRGCSADRVASISSCASWFLRLSGWAQRSVGTQEEEECQHVCSVNELSFVISAVSVFSSFLGFPRGTMVGRLWWAWHVAMHMIRGKLDPEMHDCGGIMAARPISILRSSMRCVYICITEPVAML